MHGKILALGVAAMLWFSGCANGVDRVSKTMSVSAFDLSRYSEKGFLFTPYKYDGAYQSIAIVSAALSPGAKITTSSITVLSNAYNTPSDNRRWEVEHVDPHEALDSLYFMALKMGADAIVDFRMEEEGRLINSDPGSGYLPLSLPSYKISGFAIKRESK